MGNRSSKRLNRRLSGGIRIRYQEKPSTRAEQIAQRDRIVAAFTSVLSGILSRAPSEEEILGFKSVTFQKEVV